MEKVMPTKNIRTKQAREFLFGVPVNLSDDEGTDFLAKDDAEAEAIALEYYPEGEIAEVDCAFNLIRSQHRGVAALTDAGVW
jgi:hypothetical protein